ncbi:MAG: RHS repeat-associated core domain-containing protein, partial [bacterium]|nr:RHS repeat-associated core domain-containing protein [bacterium]
TSGDTSYSWDANGNLTEKAGEATYGWDFEDRLETVTLADGTVVTHTYDADGVRVRTEVTPPGGPSRVTDYLVDTAGPLSQVVAETDGSGALTAYYVRGDDLLAVLRATDDHFYHHDGLGSIRVLTDEQGEATDRYAFTAFGELLEHQGEDPNTYLFAGESLDPDSGFYHLRARWMAPGMGRFAGMDPFQGLNADPGSLHSYIYARSNPANLTDASGLFAGDISSIVAALAVASVSARASNTIKVNVAYYPIVVRIKPIIASSEWTYDEVREQLLEAERVYGDKFGIRLQWNPLLSEHDISGQPESAREVPEVVHKDWKAEQLVVENFRPSKGDGKTIPVIFIKEFSYLPEQAGIGIGPKFESHVLRGAIVGRYWQYVRRREHRIIFWGTKRTTPLLTTAHELGHAVGNLDENYKRYHLMGDLDFPGDNVLEKEIRQIRERARW